MSRNPEKTVTLTLRRLREAQAAADQKGIALADYLELPEAQPRLPISIRLLPIAIKEAKAKANAKGVSMGTLMQSILERSLLRQ